MNNKPNKVLRLKIAARCTLVAFEIRSDLTGNDLDNYMSVVYTKAALIELGYGENADTELAMRLMLEAAKLHVPKRVFAPGGVVLPVNQVQLFSGQYHRTGEDVEYIIKPNFLKKGNMSIVSYKTAVMLKQAAMPQPEPYPGQFWYGKRNAGFDADSGSLCILIGSETGNLEFKPIDGIKNENNKFFVFAPDLDHITPYLPEGFILEMWDGRHSCKVETEETTIRKQADSFVEAAALAYLSLHETI